MDVISLYAQEQAEIILKFNILHLPYVTYDWARIESQSF